MKLTAILLTVFCIQVSANAFSQKINLSAKSESLKTVLSEIKKQSGYHLLYNTDLLENAKPVNVKMNNASLEDALKEVLRQQPFIYEISDHTILIKSNSDAIRLKTLAVVQKETITGKVSNASGNALAGATVFNRSQSITVMTDAQGNFSIPAKIGDVLVISFVGLETKEIRATKSILEIKLNEKSDIDEVIITGYQTIDKRQSTSAISVLKTKDIAMVGATNIEQMLQGQLPGLSVVNTSTGPGAPPKLRIRGVTTITGNADPLWVLDGVILENAIPISVSELNNPDVMNSFNSVIGGVSPNDIESITILKDASAAAIYGTRAANGVIVVTTKSGARNGLNNIAYQHSSTISLRPNYNNFDLMNSQERVQLTQQIYDDGLSISGSVGMEKAMSEYALGNLTLDQYKNQVRALETRNTDWFDILYRNAYTQTHNLSTSGGTEKMDYYISLGYNGEQGMDKVSNYNNYSAMAKTKMELFKGARLETIFQAGRRDRQNFHSSIDPFLYSVRTSRTIPLYDEEGKFFFPWKGAYDFNILNEQENTFRGSKQMDLKGTLNLKVDLVKGLSYSGLYSYSSSNSSNVDYAKEQSAYVSGIRGYNYGNGTEKQIAETSMPFGGVYNERLYDQRTSLLRNGLEYKGWLMDELSIDGMIGQEFRTTQYDGLTTNSFGYMHDRGNVFYQPAPGTSTGHLKRNSVTRDIPTRSYISYYAVLSSMYKDRYVINGNIRFDGSNLFGSNPKYRYLPLWSLSGKWIVSNEDFLKDSEVISNLAVRSSYGLRGNIVEDSSPQIIAAALPPNKINDLLEMNIIQAPNPNLKWETTSSFNLGLELGFFQNRIIAGIDYYQDYSRDLIAYKDISSVTGFLNKYVNYADIKNEGIDIAISGKIIQKGGFSWTTSINMGYVKNRVTSANVTPQAQNLVKSIYTPGEVFVGKPVNGMFSYRFAGLDDTGMPTFYDADNNRLSSADPTLVSAVFSNINNLQYEGARDPILNGGINNTVRYKSLSISTLFSFGLKNVVRLPNLANTTSPSSDKNANRSILDRWRNPGDELNKDIPRLSAGSGNFSTANGTFFTTGLFNQSQKTVVPGDYLRLRNVMMEYRLPKHLVQRLGLRDRKLSEIALKFQVQNLFVLADKRLKGYDPETINYTTSEYGAQSLPTSFTIGLNVNF